MTALRTDKEYDELVAKVKAPVDHLEADVAVLILAHTGFEALHTFALYNGCPDEESFKVYVMEALGMYLSSNPYRQHTGFEQ